MKGKFWWPPNGRWSVSFFLAPPAANVGKSEGWLPDRRLFLPLQANWQLKAMDGKNRSRISLLKHNVLLPDVLRVLF